MSPLDSCLLVGWMHLAVRSKSARKILNKVTYKCDACDRYDEYFVQILASIKPATYHTICIDCLDEETWQTKISLKESTTKKDSANGSTKSVSKTTKSPSPARSEDSGVATSTSHWADESW